MHLPSQTNYLASAISERKVLLAPAALQGMQEDAEKCFPHECCGFLLGTEEGKQRQGLEVMIVPNVEPTDPQHRYLMDSKAYFRAEAYAEDHQLRLLGVYHSHPGHPAIPSLHDHQTAWPGFSYLIIPLLGGKAGSPRSWVLNAADQFAEESVMLLEGH